MAAEPKTRHLRIVPGADRRPSAAALRRNRRTVRMLLVATSFLTFAGLLMVLSASAISAYAQFGSGFLFFQKQLVFAVIGVCALVATARMPYEMWQKIAGPFLGATAILLLVVLHPTAGHEVYGSSRWIQIGPVTIQPSEFAKLAMALFVARFLAKRGERLHELGDLLPLFIVTFIVGGMVMFQPDLGTTLVIASTVFLMLFVSGARLQHLGSIAAVGFIGGMGLIWSAPYRRVRFLGFLDPWADPKGKGFQLIQGLIAFGSGGISGVGLGASRQKWLYVPNAHTDFIFAIIGEELGLVGTITLLVAYALLIHAGIRVASSAPDAFGRILAAGIVSWFGVQTLVNLGAVTGVLPITGVPLPFLSYGGSSLVVSLAAVGILVNIANAGSPAASARRSTGQRKRAA